MQRLKEVRCSLAIVVLSCLFISGCGVFINRKAEAAIILNRYLGKPKDEFIKKNGPPTNCVTLTTGEETCQWVRSGVNGAGSSSVYTGYGSSSMSSWEHRIIYTYNRDGIAREWNYRGDLGAFSHIDYPEAQ